MSAFDGANQLMMSILQSAQTVMWALSVPCLDSCNPKYRLNPNAGQTKARRLSLPSGPFAPLCLRLTIFSAHNPWLRCNDPASFIERAE